jgi:hypothetical protein
MPNKIPSWLRYLIFLGVTLFLTYVFIVLPRRVTFILFAVSVIYPALTALILTMLIWFLRMLNRAGIMLRIFLSSVDTSDLTSRKFRKIHLLEIVFILLFSVFVTRHHFDFNERIRVRGHEVEWLTGYGQIAYQGLQETGTIPMWNPYYRQGEPLIDSAFNYVLNPFSSGAQLLLGSTQGTKYSVAINSGLAAVGGWFLGWVLGLSGIGRLTLALLVLGKGNMHTNFDAGYYQLAVQQAYFPWVIAGTIAVLTTHKRWAIVLTAVSWTLMFFAGNLWHLLPMAISVAVVTVAYSWSGRRFDFNMWRRMGWAGLLTVGLSSVTLLSVVSNFGLIEAHPDEVRAGWEIVEPNRGYLLPFIGDYEFATLDLVINQPPLKGPLVPNLLHLSFSAGLHFYYSYVAPWWFVILLLIPIPFFWRYRKILPDNRLMWGVGFGLFILFTMWGMGGTPLFIWLYEHVPHLAQWRFVPRAFAMSSFWIAVLVAIRVDSLVRVLVMRWEASRDSASDKKFITGWYKGLFIFYVGLTGVALVEVNERWQDYATVQLEPQFARCMNSLREEEPDAEQWLWVHGYNRITDMLENKIRMINIEADYLPGTPPNTIGDIRLDARVRLTARQNLSELESLGWFLEAGYRPLETSASYFRIEHCIYENPDFYVPYAFTMNLDDIPRELETDFQHPKLSYNYFTTFDAGEVVDFVRLYDTIVLRVRSDDTLEQALVIQELAFPGWEVWIDGELQPREIFAKLNAVILPTDGKVHEVIFIYRPPLVVFGAIITILSSLFCVIYLLRLDRFWHKLRK